MKGLLIEDDKVIADTLLKFLKEKNILLDFANDGKIGLNMALSRNYEVILLDYNLAGLNGLEITKKLRAKKNNTPIIMISVRHELEDKLSLLDSGVDDYITKPFSLSELCARIKAVTRRPLQLRD